MDLLWPSKKQESSKPSPQHKAVDRRELSPNELYAYTKDIELQLEQSEAKRADLLLELEAYTGASANLTWDSTALLQQRAIGAEVKLTRVEKAFSQLSVEHASLSDDFAKLKEAKRLSDQSGREATKKTWRIENERSFYQKQAAEAMQARDRAEVEASRVQEKATSLESSLAQKDTELRAEQSELMEVRQRLQGLQEEADGLRAKAKVASQVPQLRLDLQECQSALEQEQQARNRATDAHQQSERKLREQAVAMDAAEHERSAAEDRCSALEADLAAAHKLRQQLQHQLQEFEGQAAAAAAAEARAKDAEDARAKAEERLEALEQEQRDTAAELAAARADIAELSGELASAKASADDLTAKIAEVAAEKMRLLVENAELQERERESNTHEREDDDDAWGAWPWKRASPMNRTLSPGSQAAALQPQAAPTASPS